MPIDPSIPLQGKTPQLPSFADNIAKIQNIKNMQAAEAGIRAESDERKRNFEARMAQANIMKDLIPINPKTGKPSYNAEGKLQNPETGEVVDMGNVYRQGAIELTRAGYGQEGYKLTEQSYAHDQSRIKTDEQAHDAFKSNLDTLHGYVSALPADQQEAAYNQGKETLQKRYPYMHYGSRLPEWQNGKDGNQSPTLGQLQGQAQGIAAKASTDIALAASGLDPKLGHMDGNSKASKDLREFLKAQGVPVPDGVSVAQIYANPALKGALQGYPTTIQIDSAQRYAARIASIKEAAPIDVEINKVAEFKSLLNELKNDPNFSLNNVGDIDVSKLAEGSNNWQRAILYNTMKSEIMPNVGLVTGWNGVLRIADGRQTVSRAQRDAIMSAPNTATGEVNPTLESSIIKSESGGNHNAVNKTTGASGQYQILESTWRHLVDTVGVPGVPKGTPFSKASDPIMAKAVFDANVSENTNILSKSLGRAPSNSDLKLAHVFGAGGAAAILKANPNDTIKDAYAKAGMDVAYSQAANANKSLFNDKTTVAEIKDKHSVGEVKSEVSGLNKEQTAMMNDFKKVKDDKSKKFIRDKWLSLYPAHTLPEEMKDNSKAGSSKDNPVITSSRAEVEKLPLGTWVKYGNREVGIRRNK